MLPDNLPDVARATLPDTYEGAKKALAQCADLDECKDWKDKAAALASYAKQSKDEELLNLATRIKARAVRRCGELLQEIEPQRGANQNIRVGAHPKVHTRELAAADAGLSEHQRKTALRVATVPAESFEQQVESDKPPTIEALAAQGTAKTVGKDGKARKQPAHKPKNNDLDADMKAQALADRRIRAAARAVADRAEQRPQETQRIAEQEQEAAEAVLPKQAGTPRPSPTAPRNAGGALPSRRRRPRPRRQSPLGLPNPFSSLGKAGSRPRWRRPSSICRRPIARRCSTSSAL